METLTIDNHVHEYTLKTGGPVCLKCGLLQSTIETHERSKQRGPSSLNEEGKWQLVNRCRTLEELEGAIRECQFYQDENGTQTTPDWTIEEVRRVYRSAEPYLTITPLYGIRQQLMHIMYYEARIHTL